MTVKGDILQHLKPVLIDVNAWTVIFGLSVILDLSWLLHDLVRSKDVHEGCYGGYSPDALENYVLNSDPEGIAEGVYHWFADKCQYHPHSFIVVAEERAPPAKADELASRNKAASLAKEAAIKLSRSKKKGKEKELNDSLKKAFRRTPALTFAIAKKLQKLGIRVIMCASENDPQVCGLAYVYVIAPVRLRSSVLLFFWFSSLINAAYLP